MSCDKPEQGGLYESDDRSMLILVTSDRPSRVVETSKGIVEKRDGMVVRWCDAAWRSFDRMPFEFGKFSYWKRIA